MSAILVITKAKNMDEQETVELEISDEDFLRLAKEAHMQDLTLNQYINNILKDYLDLLA